MKATLLQRATSGLLAGIFALAGMADVYGLHACPHHDHDHEVPPTPTAPAAEAPSSAHGTDLSREDPGHGAPAEGPCTCVGACHGSATTPVVASASVSSAANLSPTERSVPAPAHSGASTDPTAFLAPYPNGPPPIG